MQFFTGIFISLKLISSFLIDTNIEVDRKEAQEAFEYLNEVRRNPGNHFKDLGYEKNIKVSAIMLRWNDTLARVAEAKARDMAERNYFGHTSPDGYGMNYSSTKKVIH